MEQNSLALPSPGPSPAHAANPEDLAAKTFLARYSGGTKVTYTFAIRRFFNWCQSQSIPPLDIKRPFIEAYMRSMEDDELAPSTRIQQLGIIRGFYRIAVMDEYLEKDPSLYIRKPRNWQPETRLLGLTRYEMGDLFRAAKKDPVERCAIALMAMLGLRVSEAAGLTIEDTQHELQGHRVIRFTGKGSKPATIPLPVSLQRVIDAAIGDRTTGPLLTRNRGPRKGQAHDRRSLAWTVQRLGQKAGIEHKVHPHELRHTFVQSALDAGLELEVVEFAARHEDPRTTVGYTRARNTLDRHGVHTVAAYHGGIV